MSQEVSERREEILSRLEEREWYRNSPVTIKWDLAKLPEDHNPFLADLATRPSQIGSITVHRLVELLPARYAAITAIFEVTQPNVAPYTYEYISWKQGPMSGSKGIVFIASEGGEITHFVILRGFKFAVAGDAYDVAGGFADPTEEGIKGMLSRLEEEIKEELGAPELVVKEVHELGRVMPDAGMTNNHPQLFAAVIDSSQAERIGELPNPDPWEIASLGPVIFPVERLLDTTEANDDSYFHVLVTRSMARGLLPASLLSPA